MTTQVYRHGEIIFEIINKLPENLKKEKTKTILTGSNNNPHTYDNGFLYFQNKDAFVFGYFEAKNTKLYHCEHSPKGVSLPDNVYCLRHQVEVVNKELKVIID